MSVILSQVIGGKALMAFWYHFAILFEALFILTTIDAGTRVGRFMIQDLLGNIYKPLAKTDNWGANILATSICVAGWGYFLYQGVIDPLGGINTLWPLFGIANQMLAGIALLLGTTILFKMGKKKYGFVTILPLVWVLTTTLTAAWQKLFHENPRIGFLSHAKKFQDAADAGTILPPAKTMAEMSRVIMNDYIDAALCAIFIAVVVFIFVRAVTICIQVVQGKPLQLQEAPYIARPDVTDGEKLKYA
ncbi:MAG: carbon starvation CstA family protein, partial [Bacilli bacterium]